MSGIRHYHTTMARLPCRLILRLLRAKAPGEAQAPGVGHRVAVLGAVERDRPRTLLCAPAVAAGLALVGAFLLVLAGDRVAH